MPSTKSADTIENHLQALGREYRQLHAQWKVADHDYDLVALKRLQRRMHDITRQQQRLWMQLQHLH